MDRATPRTRTSDTRRPKRAPVPPGGDLDKRYPHMEALRPYLPESWSSNRGCLAFQRAFGSRLRDALDAASGGALSALRSGPFGTGVFLGVPEQFASMVGHFSHPLVKKTAAEFEHQFRDQCIAVHHDIAVREGRTSGTEMAQELRRMHACGCSVAYLAKSADEVPAIFLGNCEPVELKWNPATAAISALRSVCAEVRGLSFVLADGRETREIDEAFDPDGRVLGPGGPTAVVVTEAEAFAVYGSFVTMLKNGKVDVAKVLLMGAWAARKPLVSVPVSDGPPDIASIPGIGDLKERLERLVARMQGRSGAGTGILFHGPPGTGKTMIARATARASGRNLVVGSFAEWQGAGEGHLGSFLGAMAATFREARDNAPSMLFIDELDSFGTRASGGRNDSYFRAVINGFLELVQGFRSRGDVVLVGATNDIAALDPAIVRAGRFGQHVRIPEPGLDEMAEIADWYIRQRRASGQAVAAGFDGRAVSLRCIGESPATVKGLVEEAGNLADEDGTPLSRGHLDLAIAIGRNGGVAPKAPILPRRSTAIHEAGHALAIHAAQIPGVEFVSATVEPGRTTNGFVAYRRLDDDWRPTVAELLAETFSLLAGRQAEVACGEMGALGFGASEDLKKARLLCRRLACHGVSPAGISAFVNPKDLKAVDKAAEAWLGVVQARVAEFASAHRAEIEAFADVLFERRTLVGSEVAEIAAASGIESGSWAARLLPRPGNVPASDEAPPPAAPSAGAVTMHCAADASVPSPSAPHVEAAASPAPPEPRRRNRRYGRNRGGAFLSD